MAHITSIQSFSYKLNKQSCKAASAGNLDRVKDLITKDATINPNISDATLGVFEIPLHAAIKKGTHLGIVQYLITDVNAKDIIGQMPLHLAVQFSEIILNILSKQVLMLMQQQSKPLV
ncbi:hypothetical protein BIY23_04535 [Wolbachia pipientis]|uniref:Uncharacterized protein n=1 Tax=Wolbachia pipientis TaxID=955 RepID=A0A1E7QK63_WOLPI|nr:ankyrin repeat domain-containing protein [Wolbachia pipientis]OEY86865.1 hypothetical protein BIY23_04535 [Wolbachia pipientis]